jgi:hypothetical protein
MGPASAGAPEAPQVERRNWDLNTCLFCLRRGRFPGAYCKPEHEAAAKGRRPTA